MSKSYVSLDTVKAALSTTLSNIDTRLLEVAEAVTRQVDTYVGRSFQPWVGTLYYDGPGGQTMLTEDFVSIASLKEDSRMSGTFDVSWSSTDWFGAPYTARPTARDGGEPFTSIVVSRKTNGTQDAFMRGQRNYELIGTFGFTSVTETAGVGMSANVAVGATSFDVDDGTALKSGETIQVNNEYMYIKSTGGTSIAVLRGVQGTTAGSHGSGDGVSRFVYPQEVRESALIQTARLWKRKDSGFATEIGFPQTGQIQVMSGLDPDVKQMLRRYTRQFI
jgi:hypothetical protein